MKKYTISLLTLILCGGLVFGQGKVETKISPKVAAVLATVSQARAQARVQAQTPTCSCADQDSCTCTEACDCANCRNQHRASKQVSPSIPKKGGDPLILASDGHWYPLSAWPSSTPYGIQQYQTTNLPRYQTTSGSNSYGTYGSCRGPS